MKSAKTVKFSDKVEYCNNNIYSIKMKLVNNLNPIFDKEMSEFCYICNKRFKLFFRRHHCRWCCRSVCSDCSQQNILSLSTIWKYVCNEHIENSQCINGYTFATFPDERQIYDVEQLI